MRPTHFQPSSEWSKLYNLYRNDPSSSIPPAKGISPSDTLSSDVRPSPSSDSSALVINERHRHRWEVNPAYVETLESAGLNFVGRDDSGKRMEILELKDHPFFVGVQFHPEYLSRVLRPSKPFLGLVAASAGILPEILSGKGGRVNLMGDTEA